MLTSEQIERFHEDGFLNSGPVLQESEVAGITAGLEEILEIGPDGFAEGQTRPVLFHDMKSRGGGVSPRRCGRSSTSGRPIRPSSG